MEKLPTILTLLLPVIGIIVGASLQYFFSKSGERRKQLEALKTQAYVDYLRSAAQIGHLGRSDSSKRIEIMAALADAKTRICIYGSAKVIAALASFEKAGPDLNSLNSREKFLAVCIEMRHQSLGDSEAMKAENLNLLLFGPEE